MRIESDARAGAPPVARERGLDLLFLSLFALNVVYQGIRSGWNLIDDALIFCRYGRNAALGLGWVYNAGERVESHSSPLWVALLAAGGRLGLDLPWFARALGVICAALLVLTFGRVARRFWPGTVAMTVTVLLALDPGLAVWSLSGMETSAFALLLLLEVVLLGAALGANSPRLDLLLGAGLGLLTLARPEGFVAGLVIVGVRVAAAGTGRGRWRGALLTATPWLLTAWILTAWRVGYYGDWLPAPVRGKWPGRLDATGQGAGQALLFLVRRPALLLAGMALLPSLFDRRSAASGWRRWWLAAVAGVALAPILTAILAGGDWMGRDRYPLAALPLLGLLAAAGLANLRRRPGGPILVVVSALSLGLTTATADLVPPHGHAARRLGLWLASTLPDTTRLGVAAAGAVPFYAGLAAVDPLGISDPSIDRTPLPEGAAWRPGHMRYDLEKFLARDPDVIVWEFGARWSLPLLAIPASERPRRRGDYRRELLRDPGFRARYRPMAGVPAEAERYFTVFRRRD